MWLQRFAVAGILLWAVSGGGPGADLRDSALADDTTVGDSRIVQYGKMHEAIGQQQHQGRVQLSQLLQRPHFYGVAALAGLHGEVTILDGRATITRVAAGGQLHSSAVAPEDQATLLIGAYVPSWNEHRIPVSVPPEQFDKYISDVAAQAGVLLSEPFLFTVEGQFSKVRLHVINGACPLHARLRRIQLPQDRQPFEAELQQVSGTVVGVFAKDAVGSITHPATSVHMHLLFRDAASGQLVTGHVEQLGLQAEAMLRLPAVK